MVHSVDPISRKNHYLTFPPIKVREESYFKGTLPNRSVFRVSDSIHETSIVPVQQNHS